MRAFFLFFLTSLSLQAQVYFFTSEEAEQTIWHRIMMDENYFVETAYVDSPAAFIYTRGGFYKKEGNKFLVAFEFNSNFEKDHLKTMDYEQQADWELASDEVLPLDGKWLMAGRVSEQGINRRDTTQARKTMKFLKDGFFQWIAFNTESFQFFGSGGGTYEAAAGKYTETITFFSRDNSRVGAVLPFEFDVQGPDWFHKGFSSKGAPMHEVWTNRKP